MAGLNVPLALGMDTDCLVFALEQPESERGRLLTQLFVRPNCRVTASTVTLSEFCVGEFRRAGEPAVAELLARFASIPWLAFVDISGNVAIEAARIRAATGFKLPDAMNVAAAKLSGVDAYVTNDRRQQRDGADIRVLLLDDLVRDAATS